jgi:hypothetical protein
MIKNSLSDAKFKEIIGLAFLHYVKSDTMTHQNTFWLLRSHRITNKLLIIEQVKLIFLPYQLIPKSKKDPFGRMPAAAAGGPMAELCTLY